MKLLYIVDGRSPIALNWIRHFVDTGHEVHLVSMYPCQPDLELASLTIIPVAFSGAVGSGVSSGAGESLLAQLKRKIATPQLRTWLRQRIVPGSLPRAASNLQSLISNIQPDLIHAMRIPYEGMLASMALESMQNKMPLLVSVWGNDFTLHAPATKRLTELTRFTIENTDALHTDCYNDQRLAKEWGFNIEKPAVVLPGAGGIQSEVFYPVEETQQPIVINPRGLRAYVRNDTFFKAIPLVLARQPQAQFLCPAMQGQPEAEEWATRLIVGNSLKLLPRLSRTQMADTFRVSQIVLSITTHDGTPNTLLEALACGCFPIVGDIPSLREWITPKVNGFLVDPQDPQALADAVLTGLQDQELRARSRLHNVELIAQRAEYRKVMGDAEEFYHRIASTPL